MTNGGTERGTRGRWTSVGLAVVFLASCALFKGTGSDIPAKSALVLCEESTTGPMGEAVTPTPDPKDFGRLLSEQLMADGWTVRIPPTGPLPPGPMEARQLGLDAKAAVVVLAKAHFTRHEGMVGNDGKPLMFPVTGTFDLTVLGTREGNLLGSKTGKLALGKPGEAPGASMSKMLVSYERTTHDMLERRKDDAIVPPLREALEKYLASLGDGGVP